MNNLEESVAVDGSSCVNVKVEPTTVNAEVTAEITEEVTDDFLNQFSDEPLDVNPEQAKAKIGGLISYLQSSKFKKKVNAEAYKKGVAPRQVAQSFIGKSIGTLGDVLGISVTTVQATLNGLLDLLYTILKSGVDIIMNALRGLARIITFNKTAVA